MMSVLKKFDVTAVETYGFKIDFEKYDIVDFTCIRKTDIFYKTHWKIISAEEYVLTLLRRGYGIFLDEKVYYMTNLIPDIINAKRKNFESYITEMLELAKKDRYKIQSYLIHPQYEIFVKNAIQFYELGFDLDFVKKRLDGRVKDVDEFLLYLENRKNQIAC